jgi:hypothetical protein
MASPAGLQVPGRARWAGLARGGDSAAGFDLAAAVDGLTEFAVLAFASWTLIYDIGAVTHLGTSWLLVLWAAGLIAIAVGLVRLGRPSGATGTGAAGAAGTGAAGTARPGAAGTVGPGAARAGAAGTVPGLRWLSAATRWRRPLGYASVVLGIAAGLAVGLHRVGLPWDWTWVLGAPAVLVTLIWLLLPDEEAPAPAGRPAEAVPHAPAPAGPATREGSLLALGTALAAAIFSLFIVRPDADDEYFLSRAVWTAQHGRIPLKDVIFTNQAVKQIPAESPVSSIEVLIGALARLFGVPAASFTYYIALPVFTFVAVWAVWLLIRRWAPGRYVLCFAVAMVYLAWSGTSSASFGSFHLVRMWQGKAAFASLMVPLLYVYLTQWAEHRSRRNLLIVVAAGIAATGLTSSAALVVPLIVAAVAVPLLLARQIAGALGALLAAAYPVLAGLVVAVVYPVHLPHAPYPASTVWAWVMLSGVLGGLGGVALWTAPRLARRGVPALITCGVAGVVTVLMIPGMLTLIGHATGANAVLWRTMWVVPGPVIVGLLAAVPLPAAARLRLTAPGSTRPRPTARWIAAIPAVAACAVVLAAGVPVWSHQNVGATVRQHPSWKYDPLSLSLASKALRADHHAGYLLSTERVMAAVPLLTSRVLAVDARSYYLGLLPVSSQFINDRLLLTRLAGEQAPLPSESAVRAALSRVSVGYACVWSHNTAGMRLLEQAGFAPASHFGKFQCLQR